MRRNFLVTVLMCVNCYASTQSLNLVGSKIYSLDGNYILLYPDRKYRLDVRDVGGTRSYSAGPFIIYQSFKGVKLFNASSGTTTLIENAKIHEQNNKSKLIAYYTKMNQNNVANICKIEGKACNDIRKFELDNEIQNIRYTFVSEFSDHMFVGYYGGRFAGYDYSSGKIICKSNVNDVLISIQETTKYLYIVGQNGVYTVNSLNCRAVDNIKFNNIADGEGAFAIRDTLYVFDSRGVIYSYKLGRKLIYKTERRGINFVKRTTENSAIITYKNGQHSILKLR